jgi:hypothetical protein
VKQRIRSVARSLGRIPAGWWVALLVLPALLPLLRPGFFESHDGLFHVHRLAALDRAVRAGVVYPRWFPEFAFGYGHPVLNFYGPLSYYWGLPFTLAGMAAPAALKLVLALGLFGSALGMYLFTRIHLDRLPALVAAVVYAYTPYHLVDLYIRGALAEFVAFVWFPLILWSVHRLLEDTEPRRLGLVVMPTLLLSGLVTTHSLSALIFAPVFVGYVFVVFWRTRNSQGLARVALSFALTVGISAFYWLPVLAESRFVGLGHGASQGYRDHLLPLAQLLSLEPTYVYPSGVDTVPVFALEWAQIVIALAAFGACFRRHAQRWALVFFLVVFGVSAFMLTRVSQPVWQIFESGLAFLQYPWRFQGLTVLATAFLAGGVVHGLTRAGTRARLILAILVVAIVGASALWRLPVRPTSAELTIEAMWQQDRENGQIGATWTGEYLPIWVEEQRWAISHPAAEPNAPEGALAPGMFQLERARYTAYEMSLGSETGTSLVLHQFHYPGWQAHWRAGLVPSQPAGALGLASFDLGPGSGQLTARLAFTPWQAGGTWLSLVVALVLGIALVILSVRGRRVAVEGSLVAGDGTRAAVPAAGCFLLAALLIASLCLPNGSARALEQVNANLDDRVELLASEVDRESYSPGDTVSVTLFWLCLGSLEQDLKSFVHMTDSEVTRQPAQHDGDPGGGFSPTTRWLPGEVVPDTHYLDLPASLPPGTYLLWSGMYEHPAVRNLPVLDSGVAATSGRVLVGRIEVLPR